MVLSEDLKDIYRDLEKAKNKGDYREVSRCYNFIGVTYSNQGKYKEALKAHQKELETCQKTKDRLDEAVARRMIGDVYCEMGQYKSALISFRQYLEIVKSLNEDVEMQRAAVCMGRVYWLIYSENTKENKRALFNAGKFYSSAYARAQKLTGKVPQQELDLMICRCLLNYSLVLDAKANDKCVPYTKSALIYAKKCGQKDDMLRCQLSLSGMLQKRGLFEEARNMVEEAMKTAKLVKDFVQLGEAVMTKATILANLVDYQGARHLYKLAYHTKSIAEEHKMQAKSGYKVMKKVIETLKEINSTTDLEEYVKLYDKLGDYFVDIGCYSNAIDYYKRELEAAIKLCKPGEELANIYCSIGQTYVDNQQYKLALASYQKALEHRESGSDQEVDCLVTIFEIKVELNCDFDTIQREFEETLQRCTNDTFRKQVLDAYFVYLVDKNKPTIEKEIKSKLETLEKLKPIEGTEEGVEETGETESSKSESDCEMSDLTDMSEAENDDEIEVRGKFLRARRTRKLANFKVNEKGESSLHRACIEGNYSNVIKLVEGGHEVNVRDHAGWLPIHEAANHGYADIVEYLIKHKAHLNDRGGSECDETTPLLDACANGHVSVIRVLIRNGANVTCRDARGYTPLDHLKRRIGNGEDLTTEEKEDVQLLFKELEDLMRKEGFDFNAKNLVKRKHNNSNIIGKPIDNFRSRRNRSPSTSPPRKSLKSNKHREAIEAKKAYKETISSLRRPHDIVTGPPPAKNKSKFRGLIDESECVVDEWMVNDLKPSALKDKPVRDAYEMTSRLEKIQERGESSTLSRAKSKKREIKQPKSRAQSGLDRCMNLNDSDDQVSDDNDDEGENEDEDEDVIDVNDDDDDDDDNNRTQRDENPPSTQDFLEEPTFEWTRQRESPEPGIAEDSVDYMDVDIVGNIREKDQSKRRKDYSRSTSDRMDNISTSSSPPPFTSSIPLTSSSPPSPTPKTSSTSTVSPPRTTIDQPVAPVANERFPVNVHVAKSKFFFMITNRSTQVSWLADKVADRYYQQFQLRPKLSLTTEEGAILGLDDLVVDVCLNGQLYASVESWDLEPLPERYESSCKLKKVTVNCDLKFRLKLSETSGALELTNMLLGKGTIGHFLLSLRCQKSLRILDFSFSDIILLDKDDNLSQILSTLPDLEEINFKGTGLVSFRLYSLCRHDYNNLINIDFSYNLLDDKCSNNLIQLIAKCPNLRKIDLRYNDFSKQFTETTDLIEIATNKNITLLLK